VPYLKENIIPNIEIGARRAGKTRADLSLACAVFVVVGRDEQEIRANAALVKSQIAFYASTPSYASVMDIHGWGDIREELSKMASTGRWNEMGDVITNDMLNEFAVIAAPEELAQKVKTRYEGLLDRVGYYFPFDPNDEDKKMIWENATSVFTHTA
jgi:alkanesulfonate monooxygenase SsuD/methylene tetrahydromethanopterin reductase-like flavin-dependent oxidoreductase (luciferase family)